MALAAGVLRSCSEIQEWEPNMPYQFGCPEFMPATCYPKNAVLLEVEVQEGDVVVMGSDGVSPTLYNCARSEQCFRQKPQ